MGIGHIIIITQGMMNLQYHGFDQINVEFYYYNNGMKAHRLVVYLTEMVKYELKIQIAREMLAQNMNFCPAWILSILYHGETQPENKKLRISHFLQLFDLLAFKCSKQEATAIFQYFDHAKDNEVNNKDFIETLLPTHRDGLRKAVTKRTPEDIEWTKDLKYAFKRFFQQVKASSQYLRDYETDFIDIGMSFAGSNQDNLSQQEVRDFLKKYNKFPTNTQLQCIMTQIQGKRLKQINHNVLKNIIRESLKDSSPHQATALQTSFRGNRQATQKSNYANKTMMSEFPQPKILKTVSIYKQEESETDKKKSAGIFSRKQEGKEEEGEQTPINRISQQNGADKIHYPSQRKQLETELSGLQNNNAEMKSQMNQRRQQNSKLMNSIRKDLRTLGNHH